MTKLDLGPAALSAEQRAQIAELIGDVRYSDSNFVVELALAARDCRRHDHPATAEDLYCANLLGWIGERTVFLLRLLLDIADENAVLRLRSATAVAPRETSTHRFAPRRDHLKSCCQVCGNHVLDPIHDAL
ncbi:hypothetical protein ABZ649_04730 [Streptomyces albidoflavus]|uniref:hypothetical protein n=1 Tax=Streptomyces albidoflavus TaxID=1886 RepID=UPI0033CBCB82